MIDLRSDTVTKPTPAMRQAMAEAEVGDDVFGEDPSINELQRRIAEMLGKEAALFVPSGTMSNQIGLRLHCQPGDVFLAEAGCHILRAEQAAYAQISGIAAEPVAADDSVLTVEHLRDLICPDDVHCPRTRLVCLENTHNAGGGRALPLEGAAEICLWAADNGLARHLDGARLFNAVVATGVSAAEWASHFDTVSVCFSKGLGAPVGSALCGTAGAIRRARRHRKALGGGARQAGMLAAAALYALEHHVERLVEDHANAHTLAKAIDAIDGLALDPPQVDTNIVYFRVDERLGAPQQFCQRLKECGVLMLALGPKRIRAVTHLDVDSAQMQTACNALVRVAAAGQHG